MEWPEFQMTEFTKLLKEINGDANVIEEADETYVEVRSPTDLDDQKVTQFANQCPYQVRVIVGLLHMTETRLKDLAEHTGLEVGIVSTEGKVDIQFTAESVPEIPAQMLAQLVLVSLVPDQYAKTVKMSFNGLELVEVELSRIRRGSEKLMGKIGPIIEKLQGELEKAIKEVEVETEAEDNQAQGGLTDEAIEKLKNINSVDDILNM